MGTLVLIRHGQSLWNLENKFTGWVDVPLTEIGRDEARKGAQLIHHLKFDRAFTSVLQRARETLTIVLETINQAEIPVEEDQALNERHYGDLQGLNKSETAKKFGAEQVQLWRRSYNIAPPNGESLKDTAARTLPYFKEKILSLVKLEQRILVVAHGNSLRSIAMHLDGLSKEEVVKLEIATGPPIIYEIDSTGVVINKTVHTL